MQIRILNYAIDIITKGGIAMIDKLRLTADINTIVTMLSPEIDEVRFHLLMEEVLANYNIERKTLVELENDIPEKIEMFIAAKRLEGLSEITLTNYRYELMNFANVFNKAAVQITTPDIRLYLGKKVGLKTSTVSSKLTVLKSFFGWMQREEIMLRDPTAKIPTPKKEQRLPKALTIEELEIVRESCETLRQRALIEVFYSTGCRLSELAQLDKDSINIQTLSAKVVGKGNKERVVYFSFKAMHHLRKYLKSRNDECEALFVTERRPYRRMTNRGIQYEVDKIEQKANIQKKLTPHVMRHTFATLSMDAGIELTDLQHLMGHSNPATTLIYGTVSEERKQAAYKKYHVQ